MMNNIRDLDAYQFRTNEFNVFNEQCDRFLDLPRAEQKRILRAVYCIVGAAGEMGEALNKIKKVMRGDKSLSEATDDLCEEQGDTLWYMSEFHNVVGRLFAATASGNIEKLTNRKARGVIQGSGDNR